ncbi:acyl-CoA N-acyltransferase [Venturia nashicola]|uniref:Acyl-CoA N-acyltransferase n=1 Tax=Venturia nashicola TaxID=86259 RepID=A0A4Z1PVN9_9PEZI|nr:acyl-CoA N-acyltransferase [Venturia nashicola]TLD39260.1 acyl-CoA N-acyltransferase [Venturia nashicola]
MSFTVTSLQDQDVEESLRIQYIAFRNPNGIGPFLSPNPVPSDEFVASSSEKRRLAMKENKGNYFFTVTDGSTNKVIANAHWEFTPANASDEEMEELSTKPSPPPDAHADAWNDFFGYLSAQRRKFLGKQRMGFLHVLTTHPDHHRRGAGSLLLKHFLDAVDEEGIEAYLEASEAGKPLYARFGFKPVFEQTFDLEKYGGKGIERNTVMIRDRVGAREASD